MRRPYGGNGDLGRGCPGGLWSLAIPCYNIPIAGDRHGNGPSPGTIARLE